MVQPMSSHTADVLMGGPPAMPLAPDFDADLYELRKLADEIDAVLAAMDAASVPFTELYHEAATSLPYDRPELEFTVELPEWSSL